MNIEEYISSGILEAYVMGELSASERAEVERMISLHEEVREEIRLIEETQERLVQSLGVTPQLSAKKGLLMKLQILPEAKQFKLKAEEQSTFWKYSLAASIALTLMTSALAYNYYNKWRASERNLSELIAQNQRLASEYNVVNQRLDEIEADVKVINNPAFKRTVLNGTKNAPEAMAFIYSNETTQEVFLSIKNLKELARENQYQLWAIVDGKPVDAGVFEVAQTGLLKMKNIAGAAAFAITVEPRGGKEAPTLETMQVIGNVTKG